MHFGYMSYMASFDSHLERIELCETCRYAQQLHDYNVDTIYNQKHKAWLEAGQTSSHNS